MLYVLM